MCQSSYAVPRPPPPINTTIREEGTCMDALRYKTGSGGEEIRQDLVTPASTCSRDFLNYELLDAGRE